MHEYCIRAELRLAAGYRTRVSAGPFIDATSGQMDHDDNSRSSRSPLMQPSGNYKATEVGQLGGAITESVLETRWQNSS